LVDGIAEWSSVLEIQGITIRDYSDYVCTAFNSQGITSINFTLTPPPPPQMPIHFT
ncbi:hypothetical protein SK128_017114, partial [Halocaridina rubra]